ncbi:hypothetical protein VTJ83DRAFT_5890 [Remersonia thermophila]|uniref:Ribonucleases P/MRP subunit Pop8-like domain-containing protein n=1 Tax=Remersonia thermophila TaxID=72144 RepID=A0ABR4D869_9PEZI
MTSNLPPPLQPQEEPGPDAMDIDLPPTTTDTANTAANTNTKKRKRPGPRPPTTTLTLRSPPFAYAHLQLVSPSSPTNPVLSSSLQPPPPPPPSEKGGPKPASGPEQEPQPQPQPEPELEPEPAPAPALLDNLQLRAYLTAALRQFLGDTGAAIPLDILLLRGASAWVRVPREDLAALAAAVAAFDGLAPEGGGAGPWGGREGGVLLRVRACGDWLGALIGRDEEGVLWTG